jgi:AraC family transcriptional regulator
MNLFESFGEAKFGDAGLLCSSTGRDWRGVVAELRSHSPGEIPAICPSQMELTIAMRGSDTGVVERRGNGRFQRTVASEGTVWLCPIGVEEDSIRITETLPEVLHIYLSADQFSRLSELGSRAISPTAIDYLADVDDGLVRQIARRVLLELKQETAGGKMLIEQLSLALAAHLITSYSNDSYKPILASPSRGQLDQRRLDRVMDYIEAHIERDMTLDELAEVACLSRFYFVRAFGEAAGLPPHRYISARRLERSKQLLSNSTLSLSEIAFACCFSSQSSFTRAFQRRTGITPGAYRGRKQV